MTYLFLGCGQLSLGFAQGSSQQHGLLGPLPAGSRTAAPKACQSWLQAACGRWQVQPE